MLIRYFYSCVKLQANGVSMSTSVLCWWLGPSKYVLGLFGLMIYESRRITCHLIPKEVLRPIKKVIYGLITLAGRGNNSLGVLVFIRI